MVDLIQLLNDDLTREYAAAIQYIQHAACLTGQEVSFVEMLLEHADDEIKHAKWLSDHINFLGGRPTTNVNEIMTAGDSHAMLIQDKIGEQVAIDDYKMRLRQAQEVGDYGTYVILLNILRDEEEHMKEIGAIVS